MSAIAEFAPRSPLCDRGPIAVEPKLPQPPAPLTATPGPRTEVLLVACPADLQEELRHRLVAPQWSLREAASGTEALHLLRRKRSDLLMVAGALPDLHLREFTQLIQMQHPGVPVLDLDGMPLGESIPAPQTSFQTLAPERTIQATVASVATPAAPESAWEGLLGSSPAMQRVFRTAGLVARRDTTVLIQGESGTGKDLLARAIHNRSPRAKQPFVVINCAAIPDALLESELFGFQKGAFTGASQSRLGRVHAAHGGTLFLDEIGEMPLALQSKILRFLEQGEVQRIGASDTLKVDCRIIAATNVNLQAQVREKQFREDLYYRLAVMPILMPALRDRMDDLPMLCNSFLERFCPGSMLTEATLELLQQHLWPGNVRELRNVMERASLLADGRPEILAEDIQL